MKRVKYGGEVIHLNGGTRIVITGLGSVTPHGTGTNAFWQGLTSNRSAVRPLADPLVDEFLPVAASVPDFDPGDHLSHKQTRVTTRFSQMAIVAAREALTSAGLSGDPAARDGFDTAVDPYRRGVFMGTTFGAIRDMDQAAVQVAESPGERIDPRLVSKSIPNAAASMVAIDLDIRGPVMTYSMACASSACSLGEAAMALQSGRLDVALAGGADCLFAPALLSGLKSSGAPAAEGPGDPSTWSRPFDRHRTGMVMGEGAAVLVMETAEHALGRGAPILAELAGYGVTNDAFHQIAPHPDGTGAAAAMRQALASADLVPTAIGYINAHATSTPAGDSAEIAALRQVFGRNLDDIAVSSIKGSIGHSLGASGAVEAVACVKALETGWLPPNLHCQEPEEGAPRQLLQRAEQRPVEYAMSNSFGFGGQNGVLIFRRWSN